MKSLALGEALDTPHLRSWSQCIQGTEHEMGSQRRDGGDSRMRARTQHRASFSVSRRGREAVWSQAARQDQTSEESFLSGILDKARVRNGQAPSVKVMVVEYW